MFSVSIFVKLGRSVFVNCWLPVLSLNVFSINLCQIRKVGVCKLLVTSTEPECFQYQSLSN